MKAEIYIGLPQSDKLKVMFDKPAMALLNNIQKSIDKLGGIAQTIRIIEHESIQLRRRPILPNGKRAKEWQNVEVLYLMTNYGHMRTKDMAIHLKRSLRSILSKYYRELKNKKP